jgi:hypothetical protein
MVPASVRVRLMERDRMALLQRLRTELLDFFAAHPGSTLLQAIDELGIREVDRCHDALKRLVDGGKLHKIPGSGPRPTKYLCAAAGARQAPAPGPADRLVQAVPQPVPEIPVPADRFMQAVPQPVPEIPVPRLGRRSWVDSKPRICPGGTPFGRAGTWQILRIAGRRME